MRKAFIVLALMCSVGYCFGSDSKGFVQTDELRTLSKEAQECEKQKAVLLESLRNLEKRAQTAVPAVKDAYEMFTHCLTTLFDIQRFSRWLAFSYQDNKNDFVRCSIIIKNFATYYQSISDDLKSTSVALSDIKRDICKCKSDLVDVSERYTKLCKQIDNVSSELAKQRMDNIIQSDVVYHLANKSSSIEEFDAELEAENAIGVLQHNKKDVLLTVACPVIGTTTSEFGDKGEHDEMITYIAFQVAPGSIVTSPTSGFVVFAGKFLNYGNMLIISCGDYRVFLYGMDVLFAATGDEISVGDYVGRMSTAIKAKPILKLELKKFGEPLDPRHWITQSEEEKRGQKK